MYYLVTKSQLLYRNIAHEYLIKWSMST